MWVKASVTWSLVPEDVKGHSENKCFLCSGVDCCKNIKQNIHLHLANLDGGTSSGFQTEKGNSAVCKGCQPVLRTYLFSLGNLGSSTTC